MSDFRASRDAPIAEVAERQCGVISTQQLQDAGLDKDQILYRVRIGRLHRIHRGVFAVGHAALPHRGLWLAAVLAFDGQAVLSHKSAAALWGMLTAQRGPVDVTVSGDGGRRKRKGIRIHRSATLGPDQVTFRHRIPVTTPARTIADLKRIASPRELRHAMRQADALGLSTGADIDSDDTRSELEFLFLELCRNNNLPMPRVNVRIGPYVADFVWPVQRLIVETDGYRYHRGRAAFEADRARDLELRAHGYDVIHLTYRQVVGSPEETASALKGALGSWRKART